MADPDNRWNRRLFLHLPAIFLVLFFVLPLIALVILSFWQTENYKICLLYTSDAADE